MKITVIEDILKANDAIAADNQKIFESKKLYVINLLSSPGAGKTTLLERTIETLHPGYRIGVIEGDIQTTLDAERISKFGIPVVQINTQGGCHLEANMIKKALDNLDLNSMDLLIIENIGNLVCPSNFKLGEVDKVTILSVPEGEEKPLKYPAMFRESTALIINKIDLISFTNFNITNAIKYSLSINPSLKIFEISCTTREGLDRWINWLKARVENYRSGIA